MAPSSTLTTATALDTIDAVDRLDLPEIPPHGDRAAVVMSLFRSSANPPLRWTTRARTAGMTAGEVAAALRGVAQRIEAGTVDLLEHEEPEPALDDAYAPSAPLEPRRADRRPPVVDQSQASLFDDGAGAATS